jgi:hypothetical protein
MFYINDRAVTKPRTARDVPFDTLDGGQAQSEKNKGVGVGASAAGFDVKALFQAMAKGLEEAIKTGTSFALGESAGPALQAEENISKVVNKSIADNRILDLFGGTPSKRLKQVICLPMPQKVRANYEAGYNSTNPASPFGSIIMGVATKGKHELHVDDVFRAVAPSAFGALIKAGSNVVGAGDAIGVTGETLSQIAAKVTGNIFNSRQEQLFQSMNFRHHEFDYTFVPRNYEESQAINNIVFAFKYFQHPEFVDGQNTSRFVVPAEFDIEYRFGDKENTTLSKISTCVLASCEVNYTAIGEFVAFEGYPDPVAISLRLIFVELEPLHRGMIAKGF